MACSGLAMSAMIGRCGGLMGWHRVCIGFVHTSSHRIPAGNSSTLLIYGQAGDIAQQHPTQLPLTPIPAPSQPPPLPPARSPPLTWPPPWPPPPLQIRRYRRLCFLVTPTPRVANAQNLFRNFLRNVTPDPVLLVYLQLDISPLNISTVVEGGRITVSKSSKATQRSFFSPPFSIFGVF